MSVEIVSLVDKALQLNNGQWAASMNIGTDWQRLRVGWRWRIADSGATIPATTSFMGVLSNPSAGLAEGPLNTTCSHFVGSYRIGTATRNTSPIVYYSISYRICKKVGSTVTQGIPGVTAHLTPATGDDTVWTANIVEILKGSPNYTVTNHFVRGTAGLLNVADIEPLKNAMLSLTPAVELNNYIGSSGTRYSSSGSTVAVNEGTDGDLNAVCVSWAEPQNLFFREVLYAVYSS